MMAWVRAIAALLMGAWMTGHYPALAANIPNEEKNCTRVASSMVASLVRNDAAAAAKDFDDAMMEALPEESIAAIWATILAKYGNFEGIGDVTVSRAGGLPLYLVTVPMRFPSFIVDGMVSCTTSGAIAGFHIVPRQLPQNALVADRSFDAEHVRIISGGIELRATFYTPIGTDLFPLVVLVGGSGPGDRDSTIGPNKPMRDIAMGLARAGIGALAFDKRTFLYPQIPIATIDDEFVDDAVAAINFGIARQGVDKSRVFVLGHSLGGTMAPRIAQRSGSVAGVILLAPLVERLEEAFVRQLRYLAQSDGVIDDTEQATINDAEKANLRLLDLKMGRPVVGPLPLAIPQSYWKGLWNYDSILVAREIGLPVLLMFAGRDYQVVAAESKRKWLVGFDGEDSSLRILLYPTFGHTFMPMTDPPDPALLRKPAHVSSTVIDDVVGWIKNVSD